MCKHKMDATPSFGATMIPEVPSNPQLTLKRTIKTAVTSQDFAI